MLDQVQNVALHIEVQPNTGLVTVHKVLDPLVFFVQAKVNKVIAFVTLENPANDLTFFAARNAKRVKYIIQEQITLAADETLRTSGCNQDSFPN